MHTPQGKKGDEDDMATTICVGDLHLKQTRVLPRLDGAIRQFEAQRVVLLGDACDDWGLSDDDALSELLCFKAWVQTRREQGLQVDVLVGNHEMPYLMDMIGPGTHVPIRGLIKQVLSDLDLKCAAVVGDRLCTHAGVTRTWQAAYAQNAQTADELCAMLNGYFADPDTWERLITIGPGRGGGDVPGPLWADQHELLRFPMPGVNQIVGHTPVYGILREDVTGGAEAWFCDTFSVTPYGWPQGEASVLVVEDDGAGEPVYTIDKLFDSDEWLSLMRTRMLSA